MSNRLAKSQSAYLKSAAHQPVDWYPWSDAAFSKARELDRPILLDIGAVWCHWCHVMDGESYENPETAQIINERFIAIKVDRDERPEIDRRYQEAVSAISGQGGWPLTAFLTPDGEVFFGGTYFPPLDRYGRRGFPTVLAMVADHYKNSRDGALSTARQLTESLASQTGRSGSDKLSESMLMAGVRRALDSFDPINGGFGAAPKFPHPTILELLLNRSFFSDDPMVINVITTSLSRMGRGGIHDHIGGGFHRYSTDAKWIVPHFEKMLYDNSELLRVYAIGAVRYGDAEYAATALGIIKFMTEALSDQTNGGFYASQDADVGLEDDGDYFTWSLDEVKAVCSDQEAAVLAERFDIRADGEMHHNPAKNVLFIASEPEAIAGRLGLSVSAIQLALDSGIRHLADARARRSTPFIDTSIYSGWNGMAISAFLLAGHLLDLSEARAFALVTLDRIIAECVLEDGRVCHSVGLSNPVGLLEDGVFVARACLDAHDSTGNDRYLIEARLIAEDVLNRLWDHAQGGLFDQLVSPDAIGLLALPRKPIQDAPTPSANGIAAELFLRLHELTGIERYRDAAERILATFAGLASHLGVFGGSYYIGLDRIFRGGSDAVVTGPHDDQTSAALWRVLVTSTRPYLNRQRLTLTETYSYPQQPELRAMIVDAAPRGYFCAQNACAPPAESPREFAQVLEAFGK